MATYAEEDYISANWSALPPAQPGENSFIGDLFPRDVRFLFEVTELKKTKHKETGKEQVNLTAVCRGGQGDVVQEYIDRILKNTFFFPLPSELNDKQKNFGARLFTAFLESCNHKQQPDGKPVPLIKMVGDLFECTTKVYTTKVVEKVNAKGEKATYGGELTSVIKDVYPVTSKVQAKPGSTETVAATEEASDEAAGDFEGAENF